MVTLPSCDQMPREMLGRRQWVTWSYAERNGKRTKQPHDPATDMLAKVNDPTTWSTFEQAVSSCARHGRDGVGFVLAQDRAFTGIDLDHVIGRDGRVRIPEVAQLVREANTYVELSPSGEGLHLYLRGPIPDDVKRGYKSKASQPGGWACECYDSNRFFTVTGKRYEVRADA